MSNKPVIALLLAAAIATIMACSDNNSEDTIKSLRIDAENAFRRGDYKEAYSICSKIVAKDSTVSFGYFGMAKASLGERGINLADILSYVETEEGENGETKYKFTFLDETIKSQNNIFQAVKKASAALALLDRRDSLTSDAFPLSDREYKGDYFRNFLLVFQMIRTPLELSDSNDDGCIAKRGEPGIDHPKEGEWANWGCSSTKYDALGVKMENGQLVIDMDEIYEEDTEDLNNKIDNFSGDMDEVISIMDALGMTGGSGDLKSDIEKYKANSAFYRVGTGIDEDGDGCIEEDFLDGQDNDGDGLANGNARAKDSSPIDNSMLGDPAMNDTMIIHKDDPNFKRIANNRERTIFAELKPDEKGYVSVLKFTQRDGYWTSNNAVLKLRIAQDTVCPPDYDLKYRQENVGGCWLHYNEEKFIKYWLKREYARNSNKLRVHPSCKSCEGNECLE